MASGEKTIFVYDSFSKAEPVLLGTLDVNAARGGESYAFSYDPTWLKENGLTISLDFVHTEKRIFSENSLKILCFEFGN